jgi:predicted lipid-binding transport protein (Tim44 family)
MPHGRDARRLVYPAPLWQRRVAAVARRRRRAHTGDMGRMIWTILGAILAIWLAFMAIGWIFAMLKTFFIIGLIAVVVFIVVSLMAKRARRD